MSSYIILKFIHIITALISITVFIIRYRWTIQSSPMLQKQWVKIAPHINDTFLLISAIALAMVTAQYPLSATWLNAKIVALLLYISLGTIALKRGKTKQIQIIGGMLAILTFAYIVMVAISKNAFLIV